MGRSPGKPATGFLSPCLGLTCAAVIDQDTGHLGNAGIAVGHTVAPADRVEFQSARRRDRRADALKAATAFAHVELAELGETWALDALDTAAYLAAHLAVFITRRAAAEVVASPNAVDASGIAENEAGRTAERA